MNKDTFGRKIDYLRLSVTFRCDLSCVFCSPARPCLPTGRLGGGPADFNSKPDGDDLSDEEIAKIVTAAVSIGIHKIRLTGGEPLLRPGITSLVARLNRINGVGELTMTTNGLRLLDFAQELYGAGIKRVNVSLPSLSRRRLKALTGSDILECVIDGIKSAKQAGMGIKLNVVALSDLGEGEVCLFSKFATEHGLKLRFIEFMPLAAKPSASQRPLSIPVLRHWLTKNGIDAEVIAAMESPFCSQCNRLRISSRGGVYPCLFGGASHQLRPVLKGRNEDIAAILHKAILEKPAGYHCAGRGDSYRPIIRAVGG